MKKTKLNKFIPQGISESQQSYFVGGMSNKGDITQNYSTSTQGGKDTTTDAEAATFQVNRISEYNFR